MATIGKAHILFYIYISFPIRLECLYTWYNLRFFYNKRYKKFISSQPFFSRIEKFGGVLLFQHKVKYNLNLTLANEINWENYNTNGSPTSQSAYAEIKKHELISDILKCTQSIIFKTKKASCISEGLFCFQILYYPAIFYIVFLQFTVLSLFTFALWPEQPRFLIQVCLPRCILPALGALKRLALL